MGHIGCRLAVTYPEIDKMQTKGVICTEINVKKNHKYWDINPEIMFPLVCQTPDAEIKPVKSYLKYEVGTLIEIPPATLITDEIAK